MAEHIIPANNWAAALGEAVDRAASGDTIVVSTDAKKRLGMEAKKRMCPDKDLVFEVR